jgi:hypothetical protein
MNWKRGTGGGAVLVLAVAAVWSCHQENTLEPDMAEVEDALTAAKEPPEGKGKPKPPVLESVRGEYHMVLWEWGKLYEDTHYGLSVAYDTYEECIAGYDETAPGGARPCQRRDRSFNFWAERYGDDTVEGEWNSENRWAESPRPTRSKGKITCFTIEGNRAWIGETVKAGARQPGSHVVWRVEDWNDDPTQPDLSTMACAHLPGGHQVWGSPDHGCHGLLPDPEGWTAQRYCQDKPLLPQVLYSILDEEEDNAGDDIEVNPS